MVGGGRLGKPGRHKHRRSNVCMGWVGRRRGTGGIEGRSSRHGGRHGR